MSDELGLALTATEFLAEAKRFQEVPPARLLPMLAQVSAASHRLLGDDATNPLGTLQHRLNRLAADLEALASAPPTASIYFTAHLGCALLKIHEASLKLLLAQPKNA